MTNDVSKIRKILENDSSRTRDILERMYYKNFGHRVDSSTQIKLQSWVKVVNSNQEFQVMEIIDENTFVCVNEKHQNGIKLKRSEIELVME
jgi:hypothetical protein